MERGCWSYLTLLEQNTTGQAMRSNMFTIEVERIMVQSSIPRRDLLGLVQLEPFGLKRVWSFGRRA